MVERGEGWTKFLSMKYFWFLRFVKVWKIRWYIYFLKLSQKHLLDIFKSIEFIPRINSLRLENYSRLQCTIFSGDITWMLNCYLIWIEILFLCDNVIWNKLKEVPIPRPYPKPHNIYTIRIKFFMLCLSLGLMRWYFVSWIKSHPCKYFFKLIPRSRSLWRQLANKQTASIIIKNIFFTPEAHQKIH
jgi:hypothetical protein